MKREPATLSEAIRYFSDPDTALNTMVELRWPDGVHCPRCGSVNIGFIKTRRMWECKEKHEKRQFSAKVGTVFEDSALGLDKWFTAIWMIANCKNGVSSYELARAIGVTQKSGWFMLHRIRLAMKAGSFDKMDGTVEIDETYVGGRIKNMHKHKRPKFSAKGGAGKAIVAGVLKRGDEKSASRVRAMLIADTTGPTLKALVRNNVEAGASVMTDSHSGYLGLSDAYEHAFVNHTTPPSTFVATSIRTALRISGHC